MPQCDCVIVRLLAILCFSLENAHTFILPLQFRNYAIHVGGTKLLFLRNFSRLKEETIN